MTWLTTWPQNGKPEYRVHPSEAAAEAHAAEVVRSGQAHTATCFEIADEENQP